MVREDEKMENVKLKSSVRTFRDLIVWQKAHLLVLGIYKVTKSFPSEEKFGLASQLRRSAASIPTNIVEGYKRKSRKEFLHFLNVGETSLEETKYHLLLARDLGYVEESEFTHLSDLCDEVGRMLSGLQRSLPVFN